VSVEATSESSGWNVVNEDLDEKSEMGVATHLRLWREAMIHDRMAHLVKDAFRGFSRSLQMRLNEHSVSFGHWTFLRILWENDGLTQRQLSEQAGLMEPTTFAALRAMEKLGYIFRKKYPDNHKKVYVFLTPTGRALKDKLVPLAEEVNEIALRNVTTAAVATTRETLLTIIQNLARDEDEPGNKDRRVLSTREFSRLIAGAKPRRPSARRNVGARRQRDRGDGVT
jgi:DNA-binding MarR family transcriptional regulator